MFEIQYVCLPLEKKSHFFSDTLEDFLPHMLYGMHYPNLSSVLFKNSISWCYVTYDLHLFWGNSGFTVIARHDEHL